MRGMTYLFLFLLLAIPCTAEATDSNSITLDYDAETYAYVYASVYVYGLAETDTDHDFTSNNKCQSSGSVEKEEWENCGGGPPEGWEALSQYSDMRVSSEGVESLTDVSVISSLKGWAHWSIYSDCHSGGSGDGVMTSGEGYGNGYTSLTGTIEIGVFEGYPQDANGLTLKLNAAITGDSPASWDTWDWWLKVWDDDPCSPLAVLDDLNMSENLPVLAGKTLNIKFYHEAEENSAWPEAGLDSTVTVYLNVCVPSPADIDTSGYIDISDLVIVASQWLQAPGVPSADIAPDERDNFVDYLDFAVVEQRWQTCTE